MKAPANPLFDILRNKGRVINVPLISDRFKNIPDSPSLCTWRAGTISVADITLSAAFSITNFLLSIGQCDQFKGCHQKNDNEQRAA